ncbi:MAG TPA: cytochrome c peroxidase [Kofleriaceae bacterium]|nr:cytochrome c peroxidase [Kofleriaceae bacterium]
MAAVLSLPACIMDEELVDGTFTQAEWTRVQTFSPLSSPPPSPTNRFADDDRAAAFGQRMFFEKRFSGPISVVGPGVPGAPGETGKYSCASCHDTGRWFIDTRSQPNSVSYGAGQITKRNSPSMVNIAYYTWGGWGGAQDQFWKQGANAPESKDLLGDRLGVAHVIFDYYASDYNTTFGAVTGTLDPSLGAAGPDPSRFPAHGKPKAKPTDPDGAWEGMTDADRLHVSTIMANLGKAFEAYERRLVSGESPFDAFVAGDFSAISASAKRGVKLFIGKAGCEACHQGQTFTDQKFHNTAVAQPGNDLGQFEDVSRLFNEFNGAGRFSDDPVAGAEKLAGIAQDESMRGRFRTKSLRQIAETGPYFHDGSVATLDEVIRHYNKGGASAGYPGTKDELLVPLNLTEGEIADLVAFLQSLTGQPVPQELALDTSAPE